MWKDEILDESHKYREEYAKSFNYNLHALVDDLRTKQAASGRQIISVPLKQLGQRSNKSLHPTETQIIG